MKTWNDPIIEELEINQTAGGGADKNSPDETYRYDENGELWSGYNKKS